MFQLIVAVIAIVLIALITLAAMWFGGSIFADSSARATYAEYTNTASQIDSAMKLYYNDNARYPTSEGEALLQELVDGGYLKTIPNGDWNVTPTTLFKPIDNVAMCERMNRMSGHLKGNDAEVTCPPCGDTGYSQWPGCMIPGEPG